jgi:hypothetical protein
LIARIALSDLELSDAANHFFFWDNVAHAWTFSTQSTNKSLFLSNVAALNNPAPQGSWFTPGPYPRPIGAFSLPQIAYNTTLGTYTFLTMGFTRNDGGFNNDGGFYYFAAVGNRSPQLGPIQHVQNH